MNFIKFDLLDTEQSKQKGGKITDWVFSLLKFIYRVNLFNKLYLIKIRHK